MSKFIDEPTAEGFVGNAGLGATVQTMLCSLMSPEPGDRANAREWFKQRAARVRPYLTTDERKQAGID